mgnify:CR=1 FL=1
MAEQWRIVGDFVDFCKCSVPCPCTFAQPPTEGDCEGIIAYRIREGNYGDVDLRGLNVVGVLRFGGNIWDEDTRMDAGLVLDGLPPLERAQDLDALDRVDAEVGLEGGRAGRLERRGDRSARDRRGHCTAAR